MKDIKEKIKQTTIFSKLNDEDIDYLLSISLKKTIQKDSILFYKGDAPKNLYVLLDGKCKVYKHNQKGNDIVMKTFDGVSLIAEIANLEKIPYPSNCMASQESTVLAIDYAKFEHYFLKNTDLLLLFVKSLTNKVFNLERIILSNITLDAPSRVAKYIYEYEEEFYAKSNIEIAQHLNITPETFSRVLKKFKTADLLVAKNGAYEIDASQRDRLKEYFES